MNSKISVLMKTKIVPCWRATLYKEQPNLMWDYTFHTGQVKLGKPDSMYNVPFLVLSGSQVCPLTLARQQQASSRTL